MGVVRSVSLSTAILVWIGAAVLGVGVAGLLAWAMYDPSGIPSDYPSEQSFHGVPPPLGH